VKHKSGLDILAGSEIFDRPGVNDGPAVDEVVRMLAAQYDFVIIDAARSSPAATTAPLYSRCDLRGGEP